MCRQAGSGGLDLCPLALCLAGRGGGHRGVLRLGYRYMEYDYDKDFTCNLATRGLAFGLTFGF